jgi:hypothetical protein
LGAKEEIMNMFRTVLAIVVGSALFGLLYVQTQSFVFGLELVPERWLHDLAVEPPIGSESLAIAVFGAVFMFEFFLAAFLSASIPGGLVGLLAPRRPVVHAIGAASITVIGLFLTTIFIVMRPRYVPAWLAFPTMAGFMVGIFAGWAWFVSRLTHRPGAAR